MGNSGVRDDGLEILDAGDEVEFIFNGELTEFLCVYSNGGMKWLLQYLCVLVSMWHLTMGVVIPLPDMTFSV